jgi:hypothetical protein
MIDYNDYMTARQKALYYEKVDKRGQDECWPWFGHKLYSGYGIAWLKPTEKHIASRIAWSLHHGRGIPDGYCICHHCDNPECQNPYHLFLGTQLHNMQDASRKGRTQRGTDRDNAKLTPTSVILCRNAHANGLLSISEMARRLGVSKGTIHAAVTGKSWRHIQ